MRGEEEAPPVNAKNHQDHLGLILIDPHLLVGSRRLQEPPHEDVRRGRRHIELQRVDHQPLLRAETAAVDEQEGKSFSGHRRERSTGSVDPTISSISDLV